MINRLAQLDAWMAGDEDEHVEFREAKNRFDFDLLSRDVPEFQCGSKRFHTKTWRKSPTSAGIWNSIGIRYQAPA